MAWREMYREERAAMEYGYGFEPIASSRLTVGVPIAASDDPGTTETAWWARRLRYLSKEMGRGDEYSVVFATISYGEEGISRSGIAILCEPSPRPLWLGKRNLVAFTTKNGETENPC